MRDMGELEVVRGSGFVGLVAFEKVFRCNRLRGQTFPQEL